MGHDTDLCPDSDHQYDTVTIFLPPALHSVSMAVIQAGQKGSVGIHLSEGH